MAVFGKSDANLPLLSHVAQVDLASRSDLVALWRHIASRLSKKRQVLPGEGVEFGGVIYDTDGSPHPLLRSEIALAQVETFERWLAAWDEGMRPADAPSPEAQLKPLYETVERTQRLMSDLASKAGQVREADVAWLRERQRESGEMWLSPSPYDWDDLRQPNPGSDAMIGIGNVVFHSEMFALAPERRIVSELSDLLREAARRIDPEGLVLRCEECSRTFIPTKVQTSAAQQYCSHRCADRVSARRRYKQKVAGHDPYRTK